MKTLLAAIMIMIGVSGFSQELKDGNGDLLGLIESSGIVKDAGGNPIGQFMSSGEIKDVNEDLIGSIDGNVFRDMNGDTIGSINTSSGEVFDMKNMKIGDIPSTSIIKDLSGQEIGSTSAPIDKRWLAAYYFFYFYKII